MDDQQFLDYPSENIQVKDNALFYGSAREVEEFLEVAEKCISTIKATTNTRLIVLDAWLLIDYGIRQLLMSALDLSQFNHEDYDLRYNLLSRSFKECLGLLHKLKKVNKDLSPNPARHSIKLPLQFILYLRRDHKDFLDEFLSIEDEYYRKHHPELARQGSLSHGSSSTLPRAKKHKDTLRRLSDGWLEAVASIDDGWVNRANKLNDARNLAAHSYDNQKITARMGYAGGKADELVKSHCLQLIEELMGVVARK